MSVHSPSPPASSEPIFNSQPFPLELTDLIIDLVAAQRVKRVRANLAACSLVCRAWNSRSRRHFFHHCRLLLARHNIDAFAALIRSPLCTLRPYVHQLALRNNGHDQFDHISDALEQLTKVVSLRLIGSDWEAHGAPPHRGFMRSLPNVVDLEVDCVDLGVLDHALQIFCGFPALSSLTVKAVEVSKKQKCGWRDNPPVPYAPASYLLPAHVTPPPHLSSLSIDAPSIIHLCHWLNWAGNCRLTTLHLCLKGHSGRNLLPLRDFLLSQNTSLEDCTLIQPFPLLVDTALDFSSFTGLRYLHLGPVSTFRGVAPALPTFIRTLASRVLMRLTLELDSNFFDGDAVLRGAAWDSADVFLTEKVQIASGAPGRPLFSLRPYIPHIPPSETKIVISTPERYQRAVSVLSDAFPRLHARGALDLRVDALKTKTM